MRAKIESINLVGVYFRNPPPTMFFSVYNNGESLMSLETISLTFRLSLASVTVIIKIIIWCVDR